MEAEESDDDWDPELPVKTIFHRKVVNFSDN